MVTEATVPEQEYDIDNPPEELPRECTGRVITSIYVTTPAEAAAIDPILGDRFDKFTADFRSNNGLTSVKTLLVRIQAVDVVYADTKEPLIFSEFVRTIDKSGRPLRTKQAPDRLATQYREVAKGSINPLAVGSPSSVVDQGTIIFFKETEIPLGRGWSKRFNLWPERIVPAEEAAALEIREVERRTDSDDVAADTAAAAGPTISDEAVGSILVEILAGQTPGQMLKAVLDEPRLKSVSKAYGVDLVEVATDESLANILQEKGLMVLIDGVLQDNPILTAAERPLEAGSPTAVGGPTVEA